MKNRKIIDTETLLKTRPDWPTSYHEAHFWEALGRAIATISFLEETLKKTIYVITGAQKVSGDDSHEEEFEAWTKSLKIAISDPLNPLIKKYEQAVVKDKRFSVNNLESFLAELRELKEWRNILCHGSWRPPNEDGKSCPLFVKKNGDVFKGEIDTELLKKIQIEAAKICCVMMDSITSQGFQFPGSDNGSIK